MPRSRCNGGRLNRWYCDRCRAEVTRVETEGRGRGLKVPPPNLEGTSDEILALYWLLFTVYCSLFTANCQTPTAY